MISNTQIEKLVNEVMENYPEYSAGNCLYCKKWDYKNCIFAFVDIETDKEYILTKKELIKGMRKLIQLALNGKYNNFQTMNIFDAGNWDATDTDALVQCAIFNEVIYG